MNPESLHTAEDLAESAKFGHTRKRHARPAVLEDDDNGPYGHGVPDPLTPIRLSQENRKRKNVGMFDDD